MKPKDQVKLISKQDWQHENITKGVAIEIEAHPHPLSEQEGQWKNSGWMCDGKKEFGVCFSGLTGFNQSKGLEGWRCNGCDYDICINCMRVFQFIQRIKERED